MRNCQCPNQGFSTVRSFRCPRSRLPTAPAQVFQAQSHQHLHQVSQALNQQHLHQVSQVPHSTCTRCPRLPTAPAPGVSGPERLELEQSHHQTHGK
ncbi:hypothetical protein ACOMHN_012167 [Nucella lapillus]